MQEDDTSKLARLLVDRYLSKDQPARLVVSGCEMFGDSHDGSGHGGRGHAIGAYIVGLAALHCTPGMLMVSHKAWYASCQVG